MEFMKFIFPNNDMILWTNRSSDINPIAHWWNIIERSVRAQNLAPTTLLQLWTTKEEHNSIFLQGLPITCCHATSSCYTSAVENRSDTILEDIPGLLSIFCITLKDKLICRRLKFLIYISFFNYVILLNFWDYFSLIRSTLKILFKIQLQSKILQYWEFLLLYMFYQIHALQNKLFS